MCLIRKIEKLVHCTILSIVAVISFSFYISTMFRAVIFLSALLILCVYSVTELDSSKHLETREKVPRFKVLVHTIAQWYRKEYIGEAVS